MTEVTVDKGGRNFRFRKNTDIGTYYQVFDIRELDAMLLTMGFDSLAHLWLDAKIAYQSEEMKRETEALSRSFVRDVLFEAVSFIGKENIKRV